MKFFRIITTDITSRSKLRLPDKFVETHEANIPSTVTLNVPSGAKWRVELKKKEDGFWFGKGLFEFAENLGLKYGHFLMFDYVGDSVFHVVVIDLSAVEVQYPQALTSVDYVQPHHQGGPAPEPDYNSNCPKVERVENDAYLDSAPAQLRKYPRKSVNGSKMRRIGSVDGKGESETDHTIRAKVTHGRKIIFNNEGRIQCVIQGRRRNQSRPEKAIAKAKAFKAEEPVCIIAMQPTYVREKPNIGAPVKCQLLFPRCFVKEYFNLSNKYATLRTKDGKTWSVEYRLVNHRQQQSFFTYGWKEFVVDNCLRSGDVCLFELIRRAENALKVVIFSSVDEHPAHK